MLQNTSGGVLSWESVSSDVVKLSTYTVSGTPSTFDWDITFDDSTYGSYIIYAHFNTDTLGQVRFRVRQAGSTKTDANYDRIYSYAYRDIAGSGNASWGGDDTKTEGQFIDWNHDTDTPEVSSMQFSQPQATDVYKPLMTLGGGDRQSGGTTYIFTGHHGNSTYRGNKDAITGFTFYPSSGNFKEPTILTCYGLKK